jgi:peptidoglycan/LPS O-acetylase OafA/YrhL
MKLSVRVAVALAAIAVLLAAGESGAFAGPAALATYPLAALACLALLVAFLGAEVPTTPLFQGLTFLGRISYGLYVFHVFAISLSDRTDLPLPARMALGLGITLTLALASWYVIESPCLRLKRNFARV